MNYFKKIFLIGILAIPLLILSSCAEPIQEPAISFIYNSESLNEIYHLDRNNRNKEDIEHGIQYEMIGKRFIDLPEVNFGETIEVKAVNFETDEIEVYDYIVNEKGNIVSSYDVEPSKVVSVEDGKAVVLFEKDDHLESYDEYNVDGKSIHYLLIRCKIDKSSFAFGTLLLVESD